MNKLVIIGNGFDLAHGLETSYGHFITWYLNKACYKMCDNMFIDDGIIKYSSSYRLQQLEIKSIEDYLNFSKQELVLGKITYKHDFFENLISDLSEMNWVDIEYSYYRELTKLYKRIERDYAGDTSEVMEELHSLNSCFETLKSELVEYLGTLKTDDKYSQKIEDIFADYIYENGRNEQDKELILNFNYTQTVKKYLNKFKTPQGKEGKINTKLINIHGSLNDENNPIIFGYGDEMDPHYPDIENLRKNEFLNNIKSFWYSKTKNYQDLSRFVDAEEFKVFILGHSCGLSDRILLNSIFEHDNCKSIRIFYYQKKDGTNDYFEKTQEISRQGTLRLVINIRCVI